MSGFLLWTAAHGWILTLNNLMLGGHSLGNRCCMCQYDRESMEHLLHCTVTHTLWTFTMLQAFGIHWVMPSLVARLLFY